MVRPGARGFFRSQRTDATPEKGALEALKSFVAAGTHTPETFVAEARRVQAACALSPTQLAAALFDTLFSPQSIALKDTIKNSVPLLQPVRSPSFFA